jgi:hypothetical protein
MTANRLFVCFCLLLLMALTASAQTAEPCGSNPFGLQADIEHGIASGLCQAVYESDLESRNAVKRLKSVLRSNPGADDAYQAHSSLYYLYMRRSKYRLAAHQLEQMLADKPDGPDVLSDISMVQTLAQFHDLSVSRRKSSTLQGNWTDGLLHIPISINGLPGAYIVDTGASVSAMSQSEAKRLGLKLTNSSSRLTDGAGLQTSAVQVADVADLQIGQIHLHHAHFLVLPDTVRPFVRFPENERGILGIPLLIALRSFRVNPDATVTLEPGANEHNAHSANLAFSALIPVTQVSFGGASLVFTLDMGAIITVLQSGFAKRYPEIVQQGTRDQYASTGVGGTSVIQSSVVRDLLLIFGRPVTLHTARVLLSDHKIVNGWADGNLGFDSVRQVLPITIDFERMRVSF